MIDAIIVACVGVIFATVLLIMAGVLWRDILAVGYVNRRVARLLSDVHTVNGDSMGLLDCLPERGLYALLPIVDSRDVVHWINWGRNARHNWQYGWNGMMTIYHRAKWLREGIRGADDLEVIDVAATAKMMDLVSRRSGEEGLFAKVSNQKVQLIDRRTYIENHFTSENSAMVEEWLNVLAREFKFMDDDEITENALALMRELDAIGIIIDINTSGKVSLWGECLWEREPLYLDITNLGVR